MSGEVRVRYAEHMMGGDRRMINKLRLLRNIGQFDSVDSAATIALN